VRPRQLCDLQLLRRGLTARINRAHFDAALELTGHLAGATGAIDFGCADGVFLPSLTPRFSPVVAIDDDAGMIASTRSLVASLELPVRVLCNAGLSLDELARQLDTERFGAIFPLETLEHIGDAEAMVQTRIDFLQGLFSIAAPDATIVVSVPTMVWLPFAVQRAALALTGAAREPISPAAFARAVVLRDVEPLEPAWSRTRHLGFNHRPPRARHARAGPRCTLPEADLGGRSGGPVVLRSLGGLPDREALR
jgi:2-polyprenyl-3-methyl-5-hydroxy-6-metoxy-1,4-benzoquinol methylase